MPRAATIWHGTPDEATELTRCIGRNCQCQYDEAGALQGDMCAPHKMMVEDQRALNGLLWAKRTIASLQQQEMTS